MLQESHQLTEITPHSLEPQLLETVCNPTLHTITPHPYRTWPSPFRAGGTAKHRHRQPAYCQLRTTSEHVRQRIVAVRFVARYAALCSGRMTYYNGKLLP